MPINPRQIKRKIRSVQNLKKITKAMEMVSAAKLKRAQGGLMAIRPYSDKLRELVQGLAARTGGDLDAPMLTPRETVRRRAYVVFAADKGLCGSYNANLLRVASRTVAEADLPYRLFVIGKKVRQWAKKRELDVAHGWEGLQPGLGVAEVREMTEVIIGAYDAHEVDEVHLVYTEFQSAARYKPKTFQFLPFDASGLMAAGDGGEGEGDAGGAEGQAELIFEPEPKVILEQLIPRYIEVLFFRILLESMASEHAARMTAMKNATDNAQELIKNLTLTYNKARQAMITNDLIDIIGGAEALAG